MLKQLLLGGAISLMNIAIHALVMTLAVKVARSAGTREQAYPSLHLMAVMIPTVSVLMLTHTIEVAVWAAAYSVADVAPAGTHLVYFAFVNYTTLGYGEIVPVERWQLLGPITAMNGVLLFGWSTALIFEVLRRSWTRPDRAAR
jgi:Ion channel